VKKAYLNPVSKSATNYYRMRKLWCVSSFMRVYVNYVNSLKSNRRPRIDSNLHCPFCSDRFSSSFLQIRPEDMILIRINFRKRYLLQIIGSHRQASTCIEEKHINIQAPSRIRIQDPKVRVVEDGTRRYNLLKTKISHPFRGTHWG
jgi:hypothetical protein